MWIINQLVMAVFHYYSFADAAAPTVAEDVGQFCLAALRVTTQEKRARARHYRKD